MQAEGVLNHLIHPPFFSVLRVLKSAEEFGHEKPFCENRKCLFAKTPLVRCHGPAAAVPAQRDIRFGESVIESRTPEIGRIGMG